MKAILFVLLIVTSAHASCIGDTNGDGRVTVDEIVAVVNEALVGCAADPTPTPTIEQACGVVCSGPCYSGQPGSCPCRAFCLELPSCGTDLCDDDDATFARCKAALCPEGQP